MSIGPTVLIHLDSADRDRDRDHQYNSSRDQFHMQNQQINNSQQNLQSIHATNANVNMHHDQQLFPSAAHSPSPSPRALNLDHDLDHISTCSSNMNYSLNSQSQSNLKQSPLPIPLVFPIYTHMFSSILPGPACVRNIIGNELCERFSYYGLRAILVLYFVDNLHWSEDNAIAIFSYSSALAYFFPLAGGYISDCYLGRYNTILYFSFVYCIGSASIAVASIYSSVWGTLLGLALMAIGTGGIKPNVSSFGADQFDQTLYPTVEHHDRTITSFFNAFYFSINLGSMFSMILTPIIRSRVGYPLAFGIPAILLLFATLIFWTARNEYIKKPATG